MQEAAQKFRRYVSNVETDIELLVFEMLDLIDSKTRTLRKLMKLQQNMRRVSRITTDQANILPGRRNAPEKRHSSPTLSSIGNSMTSITESTPNNASYALEVNEETSNEKNIEATIESIGKGIGRIQLPSLGRDANKPDAEACIEAVVDNTAKAATEQDPLEENWAEALTRSRPTIPEIPHPNSPLRNASYSSIICNLEGALSNLEGCQPSGHLGGVFLDGSVYRNVVVTLKTAIARCGLMCSCSDFRGNGPKLLRMGRSSTQPVLNVNFEEVLRRKTCSSTGCDKHARRKRC